METGDEHCVYVDYPSIVECMNIGDSVYIDDGLMSAKVVEKGPTHVRTGEFHTKLCSSLSAPLISLCPSHFPSSLPLPPSSVDLVLQSSKMEGCSGPERVSTCPAS